MKIFELWNTPPCQALRGGCISLFVISLTLWGLAGPRDVAAAERVATEPEVAADTESAGGDDILSLAAYNVRADRIEDFGLRVESETYSGKQANLATLWFSTYAPRISSVLPNTVAAKAGLRPGERILKSEGQSTVGGLFSTGKFGQWDKAQKKKWADVAVGKKNVTWTLEVESPTTKAVRTVKLVVPAPPPHWGAKIWQKPEGRSPDIINETGPLAECSQAILDHGIWSMVACGLVAPRMLELLFGQKIPPDESPIGYEWHFGNWRDGSHRIMVTHFRGHTDILLQANKARDYRIYLTSPSGVLGKAWQWRRGKPVELSAKDARVGFEHEVDLWSTKVVRCTGRWPFELTPGYDANAIFAVLAANEGKPAAEVVRPLAAEFLKLRSATEAERALFTEAYGKLGADSDEWAYTETSRGLEDRRVLVTRVDPSKPEGERCQLLSIDGKTPTPAEVQQWRDDGGDTVKPLGDIPPLASLVDLKDLRVFKAEPTAVVFELPIRSDRAEFPAAKFQALFRVNKAACGFEEISMKLRDTFRVAGVVKVTDAGLEMRFETFDPECTPQPVWLKMGGGVRVLLVKFSRTFEVARSDYSRVEAYSGAKAVPELPHWFDLSRGSRGSTQKTEVLIRDHPRDPRERILRLRRMVSRSDETPALATRSDLCSFVSICGFQVDCSGAPSSILSRGSRGSTRMTEVLSVIIRVIRGKPDFCCCAGRCVPTFRERVQPQGTNQGNAGQQLAGGRLA